MAARTAAAPSPGSQYDGARSSGPVTGPEERRASGAGEESSAGSHPNASKDAIRSLGTPDGARQVDDGHPDGVAPLGPRAVVLRHLVTEDLGEDEPGVAAALADAAVDDDGLAAVEDRKSTRLNSSHVKISYAVFCLKKK